MDKWRKNKKQFSVTDINSFLVAFIGVELIVFVIFVFFYTDMVLKDEPKNLQINIEKNVEIATERYDNNVKSLVKESEKSVYDKLKNRENVLKDLNLWKTETNKESIIDKGFFLMTENDDVIFFDIGTNEKLVYKVENFKNYVESRLGVENLERNILTWVFSMAEWDIFNFINQTLSYNFAETNCESPIIKGCLFLPGENNICSGLSTVLSGPIMTNYDEVKSIVLKALENSKDFINV